MKFYLEKFTAFLPEIAATEIIFFGKRWIHAYKISHQNEKR